MPCHDRGMGSGWNCQTIGYAFDLGVRLDGKMEGPACLLVYLLLAWGDRHNRG